MPEPDLPARFDPHRPAAKPTRIALLVLGPVMWAIALVVLAWSLKRGQAVELALIAAGLSFAVALPLLAWARVGRRREERKA